MNQEEEIARLAAELARVTRERDTERASIVAFMRQQKMLLESPMQMLLGGIISMAAQSRGLETKPLSIDVDAIAARIERGDHHNVCVDPGPTEIERLRRLKALVVAYMKLDRAELDGYIETNAKVESLADALDGARDALLRELGPL